MLEVACAPCAPPGLLLPPPDLGHRMRSVNNWLAFSLSPHLTIDATSAAAPAAGGGDASARGSSSTTTSNSSHGNNNNNGGGTNNGTNGSSNNGASCFTAALADGTSGRGPGAHHSSGAMDTLALPSADASLCIMEALTRSQQQQPKDNNWHALSRPLQTDVHCVQSQHYHQLASASGGGGGDHHLQQLELKQEQRDGPKLEDFFGGASLGGQYHSGRADSAAAAQHHGHHLGHLHHDALDMYMAGAAAAAAAAARINVNVPYSGMRGATDQQQQHLSSFAAAYQHHGHHGADVASMAALADLGGAESAAALTLQHQADGGGGSTGGGSGALSTLQSALHQGHHHPHLGLLHAALDHPAAAGGGGAGSGSVSGDSMLLADCSLQLPMTSSAPDGPAGISAIKTWLRHHQAASEKAAAGGLQQQQQQLGGGGMSNLQSLSLSMSPGSQASSVLTASLGGGGGGGGGSTSCASGSLSAPTSPGAGAGGASEQRKRGASARAGGKEPSPRKSIDTFGQRTSVYRGVTRHRWTGRYEAHLWDNSCRKEGQTRKGRQVYLGGYDKEEKAARAYDLAALKYWGPTTTINFPLSTYDKELEEMKNMTRQEYVASLRRKSSGFSRGASVYRGVTRHHQHGRWQARIGRVAGNKDLYLGTYSTQEEAAEAYDIAAIKFRGINAVTNFDISRYDTKRICSGAVTIGQLTSKPAPVVSSGQAAAQASSSEAQGGGVMDPQQQQAAAGVLAMDHHHHGHQHHHLDDQPLLTMQQQQHSHGASSSLDLGGDGGAGPLASGSHASSVMKNLQQWQLLYQAQAQAQSHHRASWMDHVQAAEHHHHGHHHHVDPQSAAAAAAAAVAFSDAQLALHHHHHQHKYPALASPDLQHPAGMHNAVLRNLMGLDGVPPAATATDNGAGGDGSCSNGAGPAISGHGGGGYSSAATGDSPGRNSSAVSEGEEGSSSKSAAAAAAAAAAGVYSAGSSSYGDVLQAAMFNMSQQQQQTESAPVKSGYEPAPPPPPLGSWANAASVGGPGAVHGLQVPRPSGMPLGPGGHGHEISPIFAVWNE